MSAGILIVDDSAQIRNMVRLWLESEHKFEVCGEAADGMEGIEKAAELRPDLIVLDLLMPRMDGLQAAKALQSSMPEVPIILFTLFPDSELANQARKAGVSTVFSKMDNMGALCDEVEKLVR
nr:response regulator transcription factor [Candidatus Acidoferrales bacterium]